MDVGTRSQLLIHEDPQPPIQTASYYDGVYPRHPLLEVFLMLQLQDLQALLRCEDGDGGEGFDKFEGLEAFIRLESVFLEALRKDQLAIPSVISQIIPNVDVPIFAPTDYVSEILAESCLNLQVQVLMSFIFEDLLAIIDV
eukprot:CAMPEP_0170547906 /NCGR_PEP_ID=MMETSP0211-20121228/6212_1 /TAXON_ID=311385 /ORGANISM="Pseudokeronopsis sp., Strain OXSARD2" /LENGTH=140 /DNA_ID=CAMNT_0010853129 /DNA_START=204 /DNA_END=626 /DNA_ORIENTATION=+